MHAEQFLVSITDYVLETAAINLYSVQVQKCYTNDILLTTKLLIIQMNGQSFKCLNHEIRHADEKKLVFFFT